MKPLNDPDASDFTTMKKPDLIKKLLSYGPQEVSFFFFSGAPGLGVLLNNFQKRTCSAKVHYQRAVIESTALLSIKP